MSAVLSSVPNTPGVAPHSAGVWAAAAKRFRSDHVGMTSLVIVVLFMLVVIAAGLGLVAKDWQAERAVPDAPPGFVGPAPKTEIWLPFTAFASTSRPRRSAPNGSVSALALACVWYFLAASSHSL